MLPTVGTSSRFLMRIVTGTLLPNEVDVNILPLDEGEIIASNFISPSDTLPLQLPVSGLRKIASALRPGVPLSLALTVTQYVVSFDKPTNV